jgi:competence protein ComFB
LFEKGVVNVLHIKNYMEEVVFHQMEEVLDDINVCKCKKCRLDIAAIALNDLPPKYIVTEKGELYTKVDTLRQQFEADTIAAIAKAAIIVKRRPRHDGRER